MQITKKELKEIEEILRDHDCKLPYYCTCVILDEDREYIESEPEKCGTHHIVEGLDA